MEYLDMSEKEMTSRALDDLQSRLLHTEWEVRLLVDEIGRGKWRIDPEHLCAVMLQLRSYAVRVYDLARLVEQSEESAGVKKTIKRRKRRKRAYKK